MSDKKIGFAVVGCGHIGKRHATMISQHPQATLVAVADVVKPVFKEEALNNTPYFNSIDALLASELAKDIDVVSVATPNGLHSKIALHALHAKKHVVLEKPMTLTRSEAEQIVYNSLDVHKHVFVVKQNRYSPPSVWLKELVTNNTLGNIYMVQLNCYWNRDERYYTGANWHGDKSLDGGTLFTQFSHFIDIMFWVFGDIQKIDARITNYKKLPHVDFEDCGMAQFEFINDGIGCINFSTAAYDKNVESSITVIAENGSLKIGGQYMNEVEYCHIKNYTMPTLEATNAGNDYGAYKGSAANHKQMFDNVMDVLLNNSSITANALEGMKVVEIIERIYKAAAAK